MKKISTAILPLPLIQEEQLSVTCERMCTKGRKTESKPKTLFIQHVQYMKLLSSLAIKSRSKLP